MIGRPAVRKFRLVINLRTIAEPLVAACWIPASAAPAARALTPKMSAFLSANVVKAKFVTLTCKPT